MLNLYTDVDDVLLKWTDGFKSFLKSKKITTNGEYPLQWDLSHWVNGPWKDLIKEFNNSEIFGQLEPYKDAVDVLAKIKNHGFKITAITACSNAPEILNIITKNLENHYGNIFENIHVIDIGHSKYDILNSLPGGFWVEDRIEGALDGVVSGHSCFILSRSHNVYLHHPNIIRVKSWAGVWSRIKMQLKKENHGLLRETN